MGASTFCSNSNAFLIIGCFYPNEQKVFVLFALLRVLPGQNLIHNFRSKLDIACFALTPNPLPILRNLIDCVVGVVRRDQHVRIEEIEHFLA